MGARHLRAAAALTAVLALVGAAGCGGTGAAATPVGSVAALASDRACVGHRPPAAWKHVVWIWLENHNYDEIVGSRSAPFLNRIARRCGLAENYQGVSHPSLPNYIAATSGDTWGIGDDDPPSAHPLAHASIFGQLDAAGRTWRSYEESMPSACALESSGRYAVKHNPAAYYTGLRGACAGSDVPLGTPSAGRFRSDLRGNRLPSFAFVAPDLCNDMHDCSVATGDAWLQRWVPAILASPAYRAGGTLLVITFDEGEGGGNRVATVVVSPSTRPGTTSSTAFDHYSLLRTTEELLGLPLLGHAADPTTGSMRAAFHLG